MQQIKRGSDDDQQLNHEHMLEYVEDKSDDEEHTIVNGKSDSDGDGGASTEEDDVSMGNSSNEDSDGNDSDGVSH